MRDALEDNPDLFPDAVARRIQAPSTINGQFDELFLHARREGIPLYVLIDEYDNFANTILAGEGAEAYYEFTHGGGFYRSYNTDMVLRYLKHSIPHKPGPDNLIDSNVRIDYGKLRHLLLTGRQLNGNFDLLRHVIAEGRAHSDIVETFPLARLTDRESFLSLLHYFGLLSIRDVVVGVPRLGIPNQTVLARQFPDVEFKGVALVFRGWELAHGEEVAAVDVAGA